MIILYKYRSRFKRHWARQMGRLYSTPIDRARPLRVCTARVSSKQTLMIYRTIRNPVHPILISITEALNLENEISYKYQMYLHWHDKFLFFQMRQKPIWTLYQSVVIILSDFCICIFYFFFFVKNIRKNIFSFSLIAAKVKFDFIKKLFFLLLFPYMRSLIDDKINN